MTGSISETQSLEQRAGQFTLQSSENTIIKFSVLLFQMYQQNGEKVFFE